MAKAEAGTEAETIEQSHLQASFLLLLTSFLVQARLTCPGMAQLTGDWDILHQLAIKFYISSPPNNPEY